ncbi:uncharacterized protein KY384_002828 [Bacidia gigantensis]|uniref:uncharacterized protein n=1 Tax=Bacidia gigantensis TaxID=2732470 RepID=UPI001D03607A|nr:uncharacterized protein KY384_002828 [Bacidia gigantensis]KAG8532950.1 hypothetical protein KY384_002828 [Bacidia gigantensis]
MKTIHATALLALLTGSWITYGEASPTILIPRQRADIAKSIAEAIQAATGGDDPDVRAWPADTLTLQEFDKLPDLCAVQMSTHASGGCKMSVECTDGKKEYNNFQVCEIGKQQKWHDDRIGDFSVEYTKAGGINSDTDGLTAPVLRFKGIGNWQDIDVNSLGQKDCDPNLHCDDSGDVCKEEDDHETKTWTCGIPKLGKASNVGDVPLGNDFKVGKDGYAHGTCWMHIVQHQKPDPSKDNYSCEVWVKDANSHDIGWRYPAVEMDKPLWVTSPLPHTIYLRTGAVDDDPITVTYGKEKWSTDNGDKCYDIIVLGRSMNAPSMFKKISDLRDCIFKSADIVYIFVQFLTRRNFGLVTWSDVEAIGLSANHIFEISPFFTLDYITGYESTLNTQIFHQVPRRPYREKQPANMKELAIIILLFYLDRALSAAVFPVSAPPATAIIPHQDSLGLPFDPAETPDIIIEPWTEKGTTSIPGGLLIYTWTSFISSQWADTRSQSITEEVKYHEDILFPVHHCEMSLSPSPDKREDFTGHTAGWAVLTAMDDIIANEPADDPAVPAKPNWNVPTYKIFSDQHIIGAFETDLLQAQAAVFDPNAPGGENADPIHVGPTYTGQLMSQKVILELITSLLSSLYKFDARQAVSRSFRTGQELLGNDPDTGGTIILKLGNLGTEQNTVTWLDIISGIRLSLIGPIMEGEGKWQSTTSIFTVRTTLLEFGRLAWCLQSQSPGGRCPGLDDQAQAAPSVSSVAVS